MMPENDYMFDRKGRLIPRNMVKAIDQLRDEAVRRLVASHIEAQVFLKQLKTASFAEFDAFVNLSESEHGESLGGAKNTGITLTSYDGKMKVELKNAEYYTFNEKLNFAKKLLDEYLLGLVAESGSELKTFVTMAFEVDKAGRINHQKLNDLLSYDITAPKWLAAMDAIRAAKEVREGKSYLRCSRRIGKEGKWEHITLDFASL